MALSRNYLTKLFSPRSCSLLRNKSTKVNTALSGNERYI